MNDGPDSPYPAMREEPELTGAALLKFVIDLEGVVGAHHAGLTPLGRAVIQLAEAAANADDDRQSQGLRPA